MLGVVLGFSRASDGSEPPRSTAFAWTCRSGPDRSHREDGKSVLHGFKSTALLQKQEMLAWQITRAWLGNYYRTYDQSVQAEVTAALANPDDFIEGPMPLTRDSDKNLKSGFVLRDRHYLSARWPGDAHNLAHELHSMLSQ